MIFVSTRISLLSVSDFVYLSLGYCCEYSDFGTFFLVRAYELRLIGDVQKFQVESNEHI